MPNNSQKYQRSPLALAITSLLAVSTTQAATITVDTLDDPGVPTNCSLRSAIDALNNQLAEDACVAGDGIDDEIVFESGLTGTIALTEGLLTIESDVTISGPGAGLLTIDAGGTSGLFGLYGASSTAVSGLTLTGGSASYGGAFYVNDGSSLNLNEMVLESNQASGNGGAIEVFDGDLYAVDSSFTNNSATYNGGAIAVTEGTARIVQSQFESNSAELGGALQVNFYSFDGNTPTAGGPPPAPELVARLAVESSFLTGNQAFYGGAIGAGYLSIGGISLSTDSSRITQGVSSRGEAAVANLEVSNSYIYTNSAYFGGGIAALRADSGGPVPLGDPPPPEPMLSNQVLILDTFINDNEAEFGGGIAAAYSALLLDQAMVQGNMAEVSGGGIFSAGEFQQPVPIRGEMPSPFLYAYGSEISGNSVSYQPGPIRGGAVDPLAGGGGGLTLTDSAAYLIDTTIELNTAANRGGGVLSRDGQLTLIYSDTSSNSGGGIYSVNSSVGISFSRLTQNTDVGYAGAGGLQCEFASNCSVKYSEISGNFGSDAGGIAAGLRDVGTPSTVEVLNSTISANRGSGVGGVLAPSLTLNYSTVAFNESSEVDRGLSFNFTGGVNTSDLAEISNSIVSDNISASGSPDIGLPAGETLSMSHTLVGDSTGLVYAGPGNILDVDPLLLPLDLNGGPELNGRTHALAAGSPAFNSGLTMAEPLFPYDQRGSGFARIVGVGIDMGAYEVQANSPFELMFSDRFQQE